MERKGKSVLTAAALVLALLLLLGAGIRGAMGLIRERWLGSAAGAVPEESTEALEEREQGFYDIHGFLLRDDLDSERAVAESYAWSGEGRLTLVEVNLREYREGPITEAGLRRLRELLEALRALDRQLILRFLYDWDGKNMETEPQSREIILGHMEQVSGIVAEYRDRIFTLQGLFVGNWGEMNGTRYGGEEHWRALAEKLLAVMPEDLPLSVRTPMQWRLCTGLGDAPETRPAPGEAAGRIGLFNDGMMGSWSDLGTFGTTPGEGGGPGDAWTPEDELRFIGQLCRWVPYGGEAVIDNPCNDFPRALGYLRRTHAGYLNRDYDPSVLEKWREARVEDGSPWSGMDGLTYIRRHLGCRYGAVGSSFRYDWLHNTLYAAVEMKNEGFAPAYRPLRPELLLTAEDGRVVRVVPLEGELRDLAGGEKGLLTGSLSLGGLEPAGYTVYLRIWDERYDLPLPLGNRGAEADGRCLCGRIEAK